MQNNEPQFGGFINSKKKNHPYKSVYFLLDPYDLLSGYFLTFFAILFITACSRSTSSSLAKSSKYIKTSAISSSMSSLFSRTACSLLFHWNSSSSSPASSTSDMTKSLGLWNCFQFL